MWNCSGSCFQVGFLWYVFFHSYLIPLNIHSMSWETLLWLVLLSMYWSHFKFQMLCTPRGTCIARRKTYKATLWEIYITVHPNDFVCSFISHFSFSMVAEFHSNRSSDEFQKRAVPAGAWHCRWWDILWRCLKSCQF